MKYYILCLVGISISLNACSTASIDRKPAARESELRENPVIKPTSTACLELKKSVEGQQAELREVLNFDSKKDNDSIVMKRKEDIARLNKEIGIGLNEYIKTCVAPAKG
jgi:cytochrome c biogenesis protein ResB